jgi:hypothetical protein
MEGLGATIGVLYLGYHGSLITAQQPGYHQLLQQQDDWGANHPVPGMTPPLLAREGRGNLSKMDQTRE